MIERGDAKSLAEALDHAILIARQAEARERLATETEAYYNSMSAEEAAEENQLGLALSHAASLINYDE